MRGKFKLTQILIVSITNFLHFLCFRFILTECVSYFMTPSSCLTLFYFSFLLLKNIPPPTHKILVFWLLANL